MEALFVLIALEFAEMLIMLLLIFMFDDVRLAFVVLILPELELICVASEVKLDVKLVAMPVLTPATAAPLEVIKTVCAAFVDKLLLASAALEAMLAD